MVRKMPKLTALIEDIKDILDSGQTSPFFMNFDGGPHVRRYERAFANYVGTRYAFSMSNGTLALNAIYSALHFPPGTEIITTPYTFVATVSELVRCGLVPVFADIDLDTFNLSPLSVHDHITSKTRGIVAMHALGVPCDMPALKDMATNRGYHLAVIEDACQALGSKYGTISCGNYASNMAAFSTQQTKTLGTGEGGMVVTNDRLYADRLRLVRNHGSKYAIFKHREDMAGMIGTNFRMTEIEATIGYHGLKDYETVLGRLNRLTKILLESIDRSNWIAPQARPNGWRMNGYIVGSRIISSRRKVQDKFLKKVKKYSKGTPGRVIGSGYSELIYELPAFQQYREHCPRAEELVRSAIWFDIRRMDEEKVKKLGREVERFKG